jgi:predicted TIM-barrel fold metal-dependent hydrolase
MAVRSRPPTLGAQSRFAVLGRAAKSKVSSLWRPSLHCRITDRGDRHDRYACTRRPAELADALRERTCEPRIVRNQDRVEVLKTRMGEEPLSDAFDHVDTYLARMDRQGVSISVLSLLGTACWTESQPLEVSLPLCRLVNDSLSKICHEHPGRFTAHAALPLSDISETGSRNRKLSKQIKPRGRRHGFRMELAQPLRT